MTKSWMKFHLDNNFIHNLSNNGACSGWMKFHLDNNFIHNLSHNGGMQWMDENFTSGKFHRWFICGPHYFACLLHLTPLHHSSFLFLHNRERKKEEETKKKDLVG
jgi:hypothetical protein